MGDKDASVIHTDFASIDLTTKCIKLATENATHTSSTTQAEAQLATSPAGLDTSGKFTLNWTSADATARQILYWTVGIVSTGTLSSNSE